jgi:hypothetical protein
MTRPRILAAVVVALGLLAVAATLSADEPKRDARGWVVVDDDAMARGHDIVLAGGGPYEVPALDVSLLSGDATAADLDDLVTGPTLIFYYSAGCPHCSEAAPDIARFAARMKGKVAVIAIASGNNSLSEVRGFGAEFGFDFPHYKDFTRKFASGNRVSSTPSVLLVRPAAAGGFESLGEFRPFFAGAGLISEIRMRELLGLDPWGAFEKGRYEGSQACGNCHLEEFGSWGLTHHSVAYWTLYEREKAEDETCVGCHVVGWGKPTGFVAGDHGSPLTDVGCEACHGPGGPHDGVDQKPGASREVCVGCHDADHSLRFDVEIALPYIDHWRSTALSQADFQTAREALLEGRAPQPLLAMPTGANLGVEACRACHEDQVKAWEKGPHAGAIKTLRGKGSSKDVGCISCHAVPAKEAPIKASDWHPEGVGCEACHGPGEKHVAAEGGTDNILGLGQTCPECVLESLCTRCHAPEHDADWKLETRLELVKH